MRVGLHDDPVFGEHDAGPGHPERPERLEAVRRGLRDGGLEKGLVRLAPRAAVPEELLRVHTGAHVDRLAAAAGRHVRFDPDTAVGPRSHAAALAAAGPWWTRSSASSTARSTGPSAPSAPRGTTRHPGGPWGSAC